MNKFYIQIALFLLSLSVYLNNKTLAAEAAPGKSTKTKSKNSYATSEEIFEKNKHLLCTNPEEIKNAEKLMNEVITHLKYHATSKKGYKPIGHIHHNKMVYYKKKHQGHIGVVKVTYRKNGSNKFNKVVGKIWDPDIITPVEYKYTKTKVSRVYNPNLVMIQQRFKKWPWSNEKYFYALATKVEVSKYETIIAMTSANINDHNPSDIEYKNILIESANSFTTDIDSEDDIRSGKLKKTFVKLAGYLIQKCETYVSVTYINSIDGNRYIEI
ncbi:fam-a protein [Plasmodium vinckei vinckei]|uniref:Fam-a protein n=1 Tax=Plasmodium vinckei vinckei TaxID=54757 RepID=A0A449BX70_PLAVN|nr:fam-a protein [Plasmodium vinckei vinckei]VEV58077.1 fam-a protein [Plasmodium vinckei vinckei]